MNEDILKELSDRFPHNPIVLYYCSQFNKYKHDPRYNKEDVGKDYIIYIISNLLAKNAHLEDALITHMEKCSKLTGFFPKE